MKLRHTLVFIRHGETDWNVEHRLQGQQDIPLNDQGRAQARRNGATLLASVPGVARFEFVTSPLIRARETMEILRKAMGLPVVDYRVDHGLKEITFGEWEGFTLAELSAKDAAAVVARESDKWGYQPPRGESYEMLSVRVRRWLESVERDTVAVSHGAVSRVIRGLIEGLSSEEIPLLDAPQDRFLVVHPDGATWH
jgi:probable phosphoglycerate mutase